MRICYYNRKGDEITKSFVDEHKRVTDIANYSIGSHIILSGQDLAKVVADPAYANGGGKYFQSNAGKLNERLSSKLSYNQQRAAKL